MGAFIYDFNSVNILNLAFQRFTDEQTIPISEFLLSLNLTSNLSAEAYHRLIIAYEVYHSALRKINFSCWSLLIQVLFCCHNRKL